MTLIRVPRGRLGGQGTTQGSEIINQLLSWCVSIKEPLNITIDSENFNRFFQIPMNENRLLRTVTDEVSRFHRAADAFHSQLGSLPEDLHPDATFEFQMFMAEELGVLQMGYDANWVKYMDHVTRFSCTSVRCRAHLL